MAKTKMITKSQVAGHIANKFELTKKQATLILEELAMLAAKEAKKGFVFPGVGKLVVVNRKARMGRNPQTGEAIKIPAKRVLKFRIAKAMKEAALK
jgi:DNA-binding protein HU-beta